MSNTHLDAIYGQIDSLPSLPSIVVDVLEVTGNPESSATDLMKVILPDQAMCAAILKIANSAFFGLPREVSTIEKAVMVLGFDEVKNVVLGKAVFNSFKNLSGNNKKDIEHFWEHSFLTGITAKIIAERLNFKPSEMFIAGLIHDIGKLAMLLTFPNIYSHMLVVSEENWLYNYEKENELFFISHDKVAHRILNRWLFPTNLIQTVGFHHSPDEADSSNILASIIQVADIVSHLMQNPDNSATSDYLSLMLDIRVDLFDLWHEHNLPCSNEEIKTWIELAKISKEQNTAILTIFTS